MKKSIKEQYFIIITAITAGVLFYLSLAIHNPYLFAGYIAAIVLLLQLVRRSGFFSYLPRTVEKHRKTTFITLGFMLLALPFMLSVLSEVYWVGIFVFVGISVTLAVGLNVCVGFVGLLDLGYVAFFATGAYSAAIFTKYFPDLWYNVWLALPVSIIVVGLLGFLVGIPTLRLKGDYLAIVTLGFVHILYLTTVNWDGLTNGPRGFDDIPSPKIGKFSLGENFTVFGAEFHYDILLYFMVLIFAVIIIVVCHRLARSRFGRAWIAIREDELAAEAMGINTMRLKLTAYVFGATVAGCCGVLFAVTQNSIIPTDFDFMKSVLLLCMVVLGGMGSIPGVITGAVLISLLDEKLQYLQQYQEYRMAVFGLALIIVMLLRPAGIIPSKKRKLELQSAKTR